VRFVATLLLWLVTTVALAVAVPVLWAQHNVVSADGYAALAQSAAADPQLQDAMASELTAKLVTLASNTGYDTDNSLLSAAATAYTRSSVFPDQFALANRIAHQWMFTDTVRQSRDSPDRWEVDLGPMLADGSFQQTLTSIGISVSALRNIPVEIAAPDSLRPGQLTVLATWGPWASVGAGVLAGFFALMTLALARSRGRALASLGVSALLVGAAGWAGLEVARRYISYALNHTTGDIHEIADVMVSHAETSLHQWLNLTLAAGGVLVVLGVIVSMLGGLRRN
jgi:hypothetical protein